MAGVSGLGSGLDVNSIVHDLMQIERKPLQLLQSKEQDFKAQLSAYGSIKNSVENFEAALGKLSDIEKFRVYKTESTVPELLTATATSKASPGSYGITVASFAQAHKVASVGFADPEAAIGKQGIISISIDGEAFSITVDDKNDSLEGIKDSINFALDNTGVKATLLNLDDGMGGSESRLVLTSEKTGKANAISIVDTLGSIAEVLDLSTELQAAQDAVLTVDGFKVTRPSNVIDDVLTGVTFNLSEVEATSTVLTVSRDSDAVIDAVNAVVSSYNDLLSIINAKSNAELNNDNGLSQIKMGMHKILNDSASGLGPFSLISELGVLSDSKTGNLSVNEETLRTALAQDFSAVTRLFTDNEQGFISRFEDFAKDLNKDGGVVKVRTEGINQRITMMDKRIEAKESQLESREKRYFKQFSTLDTLMSRLDSTTEFLNAQLSKMPTPNSNKSK